MAKQRKLNTESMKISYDAKAEKYVVYGRVCYEDPTSGMRPYYSDWYVIDYDASALASATGIEVDTQEGL